LQDITYADGECGTYIDPAQCIPGNCCPVCP
jgi:hypothetical protein